MVGGLLDRPIEESENVVARLRKMENWLFDGKSKRNWNRVIIA